MSAGKLCVVEIADTGVLLSGGEEMSLADAARMAKINTQKTRDRTVRVLQGGGRTVVQVWRDGHRIS